MDACTSTVSASCVVGVRDSWTLHVSDFLQVVDVLLNEFDEIINLQLVELGTLVLRVNVTAIEIFFEDAFSAFVVFGQEIHSISPVFHWLCGKDCINFNIMIITMY